MACACSDGVTVGALAWVVVGVVVACAPRCGGDGDDAVVTVIAVVVQPGWTACGCRCVVCGGDMSTGGRACSMVRAVGGVVGVVGQKAPQRGDAPGDALLGRGFGEVSLAVLASQLLASVPPRWPWPLSWVLRLPWLTLLP